MGRGISRDSESIRIEDGLALSLVISPSRMNRCARSACFRQEVRLAGGNEVFTGMEFDFTGHGFCVFVSV
jgi:hypothetical protein